MKKVSLERFYFVLYDGALTLKMLEMALDPFCNKTLHMVLAGKLCMNLMYILSFKSNVEFW